MNALIIITDVVEKAVLLLLLGLSIWSVAIMIDRRRTLKAQIHEDDYNEMKKMISEKNILSEKSLANKAHFFGRAFQTASEALRMKGHEVSVVKIDRALSAFVKEERQQLEKGLQVLATLGANAPFIGLFGTVLGIIRAFAYLGSQTGSAAVMSGVSQALYATAMGLFVAIPAVVAYNVFSNKIKKAIQRTEALRDQLIAQHISE